MEMASWPASGEMAASRDAKPTPGRRTVFF